MVDSSYEEKTLVKMITYYCQNNHGSKNLCNNCSELLSYSVKRVEHCPYLPMKPVCSSCSTHCYSNDKREAIRAVMRYSGPRMFFISPLMATKHLFHKFRRRTNR